MESVKDRLFRSYRTKLKVALEEAGLPGISLGQPEMKKAGEVWIPVTGAASDVDTDQIDVIKETGAKFYLTAGDGDSVKPFIRVPLPKMEPPQMAPAPAPSGGEGSDLKVLLLGLAVSGLLAYASAPSDFLSAMLGR